MRLSSLAFIGLATFVAACPLGCGDEEERSGIGGSSAQGGAGGAPTTGSTTSSSGSGPGTSSGPSTSSAGGGGGGTTSSTSSSSGGGGGGVDCGALPVCDDFEGDTLDTARWTIVSPDCSGSGTISLDTSQAHSGTRSVKVTGGGGYCDHVFIANTSAFDTLGATVHGRAFVRFSEALGGGHTTFAAFKDSAQNTDIRIGGQNRVLMWNRQNDDATLPVLSPTGTSKSVQPPANQWFCLEFKVDGSAGTIDTWVDGVEVEGLIVDGTSTPDVDEQWLRVQNWRPNLTDARFGWESYAGQALTVWFDDIALGPDRIGCGG
jgi:hypothetical protein